jgi:DNA-binding NtrC family response regulator
MQNIVIVDDKENILKVLKVILEKQGFAVQTFSDAPAAMRHIVLHAPDLIISDIQMEPMSGKELFYALKSRGFQIPVIFITAYGTIDDAVSLMKSGAVDYMTKPIDYQQLGSRIHLLLDRSASRQPGSLSGTKRLIGSSSAMVRIYERIETVARAGSTVLLEGESGTGKELVARAIHRSGKQASRPFVAVNCSAFNEHLLESELFGHEKGAFTDAIRQKKGIFEEAKGGTLFLDEVSELSASIQLKLLRVLQEKVFTRVGGNELIPADLRIIAASNKQLSDQVAQRRFREDLFYRLNVIPFHLPPLREHPEDLPELVEYLSRTICSREGLKVPSVSGEFLSLLRSYSWPGNIRELENIIERLLILNRPEVLGVQLLLNEREFSELGVPEIEDERSRILDALRACGGNKSRACRVLGLSRRTLYYKISKYHIQDAEFDQ